MDQFIVENPDYFFTRSPEACRVNPDNLLILLHHIKSAAFELPFEEGERFGKEDLMELLAYLEEKGVLHRVDQRWHWAAESYPADEVSLRTINPENVVVVDTTDDGKSQGDRRGGLGQRLHHGPRRCHLHGGIAAVPRGQARSGAQEGICQERWMWITTPMP